MYSTEEKIGLEFNELLNRLIKKNLFTKKQISIIYNKFNNPISNVSKNNLSAGAYYRQIKQCKEKYDRLIYTILLFRILNLIDSNTIDIIESIVKQIDNISQRNLPHNKDITIPTDIAKVIEQIIKKINKI